MPCDTKRPAGMTPQQRAKQVADALRALEARLKARTSAVIIGPQGAVTFAGWSDAERAGVTDVCAFRTLAARGSWELRQAVQRAEATSGRKVSTAAINGGIHSHDSGATWHKKD